MERPPGAYSELSASPPRVAIVSASYRIDGPEAADATVILAHGAGGPMDSPFLNAIADGIAAASIRVVRFEFPYMQERRTTGKKKPPNAASVLEQFWLEVVDDVRGEGICVIGGKSMGGRIAAMVADRAAVDGVVCYGYPFHPPGKPDRLRVDHLVAMRTPTLILQGDRDPFGRREEVSRYRLADTVRIEFLEDGDHSFKPRKRAAVTWEDNLAVAVDVSVRFLGDLVSHHG